MKSLLTELRAGISPRVESSMTMRVFSSVFIAEVGDAFDDLCLSTSSANLVTRFGAVDVVVAVGRTTSCFHVPFFSAPLSGCDAAHAATIAPTGLHVSMMVSLATRGWPRRWGMSGPLMMGQEVTSTVALELSMM